MLSSFRILSKIGGVALGAAFVALAAGYAPAKADEPGVVRLTALNGDVAVRRGDTSGTFAASANTPLMVSDYLSTGPGAAHAELQFDRGNFLRLGPNVQLRIAKLDPGDHTVQLAEGTVELSSLHPTSGHAEVDTPSIAVRPGSNGRYRVTVNPDGTTLVTVRSGSADLVGTSATRTIDAGQTIAITGSPNDPRFENISFVASDDFDTWNQQRDTFDNNDTGYQYASPQIAGIPDLSQYGSWNNSQQYGMGWTPNDVGPNWSPYQDGQWTWEPGYGYTWIGNEPWGWAPYHYGSWEYNGTSWAWYPNAQPTYNQYGSAQAQNPNQYPAAQYPSGQYPQQYPSGQYPQQYPSGQYPQQYPSGQYPAQYPQQYPAQYPAQYPPQYPAQYPAQYPPQAYPPPYAQGGYPYGYPPQAGYGYPQSPYGYGGYPAANNSALLWAPALVAFLGIMSGESAGQSLLGGLGTGGVGWVPLAPGEPMYPWWGAQQSAWYGYPASTYYPNYQQYGYSQQPLSSSYTTYNVTNIYKVYRNARAPHGVMLVSTKAFQNGSFKTIRATSINDLKLEDGKVGSVAVFRNVVPVTPTAANLRFSEAGPTRIAAIAPRSALFSRFSTPKAPTQFSAVREKVANTTEHVYAARPSQPVYPERRAVQPQAAEQRTIDPQADRAAQQAAAERKADDSASAERRADQAAADRKAEPAARNNDAPAWQRYNDAHTTNPNRDTTVPDRTNGAPDRGYTAPSHPYATQQRAATEDRPYNADRQYNGERQYNAPRSSTAPRPQQPRPQTQPQHHTAPQPQHAAPSKGLSSSNHGGNNNDKHQGNGH
jgi:hypothetical protein